MALLAKIFGDANERAVREYLPMVAGINALEPEFKKLSEENLKAKTAEFKERMSKGETLDDLLPEAFATVREASQRTLGQRHFDVQLMGGMALHQGKISEMRTGEGKTLVATLPAYLNALLSKGVHIVTVNDYLARRDAVWMGQIHHALGLTVGVLNHEASYIYDPTHENPNDQNNLDKTRDTLGAFKVVHEFLRPVTRREAYEADITYGTNNEYGFDYLRDNMVYATAQLSQREHNFAIIDEVDSILIDEARTPLIISAPDEESGELYKTFSQFVPRLSAPDDFTIDEKLKAVAITEHGIDKVEGIIGKKLYEGGHEAESIKLVHHLEQALRAHSLYLRDRDYVVKDGEVIIVDEFTGRLMPGRRWSEGLHQAIEAKEGVQIQRESKTLATITFQNYFRMYPKLAGMTGTAATNAEEFHKVYKLEVVSVLTHRPNVREDRSDLVFRTEKGKFTALAREIKRLNQIEASVLIGTVSIEKNERLSEILKREGVPHRVLNAKNHEEEAAIIAQAGRKGAVTVATNLAGRGVDIILGGNPPTAEEAELVKQNGGLHVFGTERHEARRIDNQLRGRSGRQGDPGVTQFYLSLEDDLMRVFGSSRIKSMMESFGIPEDEPIENRMVSKAIESAQAKIEGFHFDARKHVLEYDDVMNKQREAIYRMRKSILGTAENPAVLQVQVHVMIRDEASAIAEAHAAAENLEEGIDELKKFIAAFIPGDFENEDLKKLDEAKNLGREGAREFLQEIVAEILTAAYTRREKDLGEPFSQAVRTVMLQTIDFIWIDHLTEMDHLRDSVRLRAYGQRDPLVEYKNESVRLFRLLQASIRQYSIQTIFRVGEKTGNRTQDTARQEPNLIFQSAKDESNSAGAKVYTPSAKKEPGRNDPCPCGAVNPATGEVYKWKKCGMVNASYHKK
ncbi:MAG: preprotein translocase subunit SecA [Candidatus Sungbacteria bacterium]|nr:preprotein translocase subunit SecA [Candidatus Sungbacteria bacterium]